MATRLKLRVRSCDGQRRGKIYLTGDSSLIDVKAAVAFNLGLTSADGLQLSLDKKVWTDLASLAICMLANLALAWSKYHLKVRNLYTKVTNSTCLVFLGYLYLDGGNPAGFVT
jgi:hypothetical protein